MASLPSPTQVSGKHNAIYEAYYKQMDPKGLGNIEAMDAAKFLKKSGLSDVVLSRIWDLSDPKGRGCLDKPGFFVALKLVGLAQAGSDINMRNILTELANPPKVGEIPKIMPQSIQSVPPTNTDWTMKPADRLKFEQLFESLQPVNGMIAGNKVKGVLMDSKLPLETLGKIWDLADQDKDGNLDKHEFTVAMHLVYQALDKRAVPTSLPPELQKPKPGAPPTSVTPVNDSFGDGGFVANFPKDIAPPPVPPLPAVMTAAAASRTPSLISTDPIVPISTAPIAPSPVPAAYDWVVSPADRSRFEMIFRESDKDKDGLVSGLEVKNVFLQSGVPQNCLAHIWTEQPPSNDKDKKTSDGNDSEKLNLLQNMQPDLSSSPRSSSSNSSKISSFSHQNYEHLKDQHTKRTAATLADLRLGSECTDLLESEFDVIAKRYSMQLRSLDETQRIIAEKLISDVMFYARLGKLRTTSAIAINGEERNRSTKNANGHDLNYVNNNQ
ncbi:unnamed protein product [Hermetia illucens]|uniref:Epidermal growth factor receptor substrate 15-like 1 n=1 Tax=Hermetia illucens TaxID=343691 RepID=A0A7R8UB88_HERIL|nr:unnamed protein product [Hermetia illucens]